MSQSRAKSDIHTGVDPELLRSALQKGMHERESCGFASATAAQHCS